MAKRIDTFDEFWVHYVKAHANKTNRTLHFIGTSGAMALIAAGVLTRRPSLLLAAPVVGYGFAWAGHFLVEGNVPATFGHPAWSLRGDLKMWSMILEGTMDAEVERVLAMGVEGDSVDAAAATDAVEVTSAADPTLN